MNRKLMFEIIVLMFFTFLINGHIYSDGNPDQQIDDSKLTWMSPNEYRHLLFKDGIWEYRGSTMTEWDSSELMPVFKTDEEMTFRKYFELDSTDMGKQYRLVCYGINEYATIYINSKFIGTHTGGFSSFFFDLPSTFLHFHTKNTLEIKVQSTDSFHHFVSLKRTFLSPDYPDFIHGEVYVIALPPDYLEFDRINYNFENNYEKVKIEFDVNVFFSKHHNNEPSYSRLTINSAIYEKDARKPIIEQWQIAEPRSGPSIKQSFSLTVDEPALWSPEDPQLYEFRISLYKSNKLVDTMTKWIGFRELRVDKTDLLLNGKRLKLRGINYPRPSLTGDSLLTVFERDIEILKAMNMNSVRTFNHIPHPYFTYLCDLNGILLFQDIPFEWMPVNSILGHFSVEAAEDYVRESLERDRTNVSFMGIGTNFFMERDPLEERYHLETEERNQLFYTNVYHHYLDRYPLESGVINLNILHIDYDEPRLNEEIVSSLNRSNVLFVSIMTPLKSRTDFIDRDPVANQKLQANHLNTLVNQLQAYDSIDGFFINSLRDWQTSYPMSFVDAKNDPYCFRSGVLHRDEPRIAYKYLSSLNENEVSYQESIVKLNRKLPNLFPIVGIVSIMFFLLIYNSRKYFQENTKRIFIHSHGFFVDIRDRRKIPITHTFLTVLFYSIGLGLVYTTVLYFYKEHFLFDHLLTLLLIKEEIKEKLLPLLWQPGKLLIILTLISFLMSTLQGFIVFLLARIFRKGVSLGQTLTIIYWTHAIYMALIPLGMVLYRILAIELFSIMVKVILILITLWFLMRLIKAIKVLFYWSGTKAVALVTSVLLFGVVVVVYFYYNNYGNLDYFLFYVRQII